MLINKKNEMKDNFKDGFSWQQAGNGSDAVVCLHGWLDNSNSFKPIAELLTEDQKKKYTWYFLDLPGHGKSDWKSDDAQYYFVEYVYDVMRFMQTANINSAHFVGHSMGALIANLLASTFPDYVRSLNLIDGIGLIYQGNQYAKTNLVKAFEERQKLTTQGNRWFDDRSSMIKARAKVGGFNEQIAEVLMERTILAECGKYRLSSDPKLKLPSTIRLNQEQALSLLDKISVDTMLILPEEGYAQMRDNMKKFLSCFDKLSVSKVSGGHHCHMQHPQDILNEIVGHIEKQVLC
ncbi:alpha/beta hydrolase [Pseudoalteromonas luteoviolacea]|uniref:alpha/beta fold hydrolase n=1 Tax=Pseudoalteromonas luteoviolacea TaxID=43657 RepID=UPI001F1C9DC9|nr:alpha/beta hydrolase [Pseudoalteromonas luteoviolacea]MCF6442173.1 alpha/beta hydrolase [Pseudoalteromonas luteoviolacea]